VRGFQLSAVAIGDSLELGASCLHLLQRGLKALLFFRERNIADRFRFFHQLQYVSVIRLEPPQFATLAAIAGRDHLLSKLVGLAAPAEAVSHPQKQHNRSRLHRASVPWGGGSLVALLGTVLDERPHSLLCDHMISDFDSVVESEDYHVELSWVIPGLLRNFDLPDLIGTLAPRLCTLINAVDARGDLLPILEMKIRFETAIESFSREGYPDKLQLIARAEGTRSQALLDWLEHASVNR
jgi:hypothetical protein